MSPPPAPPTDGRGASGAFAYPDFRRYQAARLLSIIGLQMQSVALGWQVYGMSGRKLDLGLLGLAQFIPFTLCVLPGGQAADRFDRRTLLITTFLANALCGVALLILALGPTSHGVWPIYAVAALVGATRALSAPAASALTPHLVPTEEFHNAVAWASTARQIAVLLGPAVGGLLYSATGGAALVYGVAATCCLAAAVFAARIEVRLGRMEHKDVSLSSVLAGFGYVWRKRLLLGTFSLDLFAVLLGGATALLPVFARDVLHTGPWGLGLLRSAPAVGAGLTAFWLARHPLERRAGPWMLGCVFAFGVFTVVFGLSTNLYLSLGALALLGASDMVSVVVRLTLEQLGTPPEMRGRVSAVNMMFIGASNELGEFESGVTAEWLGLVPSVLAGGVGTCLVVLAWSRLFPELARVDRLDRALA